MWEKHPSHVVTTWLPTLSALGLQSRLSRTASMPEVSRSLAQFRVAETRNQVIVDHARGLHEGVANGRADEAETALLQIFAEDVGFGGLCREAFVGFPGVLFGLTADEAPNVSVKRAEFFLNFQEGAGVADGGVNFKEVANDSSVAEQFAEFLFVVARDFLRIKAVQHLAIPRALLHDCVPAQARLRTFQYQELKPCMLVIHGHTPFLVVIGDVQLALRPGTTHSCVLLVSRHGLCDFTPAKFSLFLRRRDKPRLLPDKMMRSRNLTPAVRGIRGICIPGNNCSGPNGRKQRQNLLPSRSIRGDETRLFDVRDLHDDPHAGEMRPVSAQASPNVTHVCS